MPEMTAADVVAFYRQMQGLDIEIWIDGGWGVDALLGEQTRRHADLDIVIEEKDSGLAVSVLEDRGYREVPRPDSRPCNFVMGDSSGREIDFHVIAIDDDGNGLYGPPDAVEGMYPAEALRARGLIGGLSVRCTSAAHQIQAHTGYDHDENDVRDVTALAGRFGLDLPPTYRKAQTGKDPT